MQRRTMTMAAFGVAALFTLLTGCGTAAPAAPAKSPVLETVNGVAITKADVTARTHLWTLFNPSSAKSLLTKSGQTSIQQRLEQEILLQDQAKKQHLKVSQSQLNSEQTSIEQGLVSMYGSQKSLQSAEKKLSVTPAAISAYLARVLVIQTLLQGTIPTPKVTQQQELSYYNSHRSQYVTPEQYHVRHILVPTQAKAKAILAQLQKGANFAALAKKNSTDPQSAPNGGDLGWVTLSQLVPSFANAVKTLKVGHLSGIVHSRYGYHILEVLAVKPQAQQPFSSVSSQIQQQLVGQKENADIDQYIQRLRAKAVIRKGSGNRA